jgi:hypothetical protein
LGVSIVWAPLVRERKRERDSERERERDGFVLGTQRVNLRIVGQPE